MIYEIPIIPGQVPPVIHVSQGDINRTVTLQITGDSIPTSVASCYIKGIRPDGAGVEQVVIYGTGTSKGLINWAVDKLFTEIEGDVICEVYLTFNAQYIGTQNFILRVEKAAYDPNAPKPWSSVTITEPGTYNVRPYGEVIVDMEAGPKPEGMIEINENGEHDVEAYKTASINVPQHEVSGTKFISINGDYDISEYANAHVAVEGGAQPEGTVTIKSNGVHPISEYAYADVDVVPEGETTITSNGQHDVSDYARAIVNVRPTARISLAENGTYDVADAAEAVVDVPSGVNWCVTPEDYGAVGDGITDDTAAFSQAVASGKTVVCAKTYLIDGVSAKDVDILMMQGALLKRTANGNDPFINVNPDRPSGGPITKKSYIRGGAIDARGADVGIAVNGSEQFCLEQVEIAQCMTGLYLGYPGNGSPTYNIESRVDKCKFVNWFDSTHTDNPADYANSTAIYDAGTDSQFSNIIVENFNRGMRVGGNAEISNLHHWISKAEIWDGSCTFRVDENLAGFFTDCCADSVETAFSVGTYSRCMVKGMSQVRSYLMPEKTTMYYLTADDGEGTADAAKTLWFFSYGSAHRGHPSIPTVFYEVSDNVYARYQSQGMSYDNHLVLEGAAISNMTEGGRRNIIPYGYQALGALKNYMGTVDANLYSFDFNDITDNGAYTVQMATATNGPAGINTGISNLIVSGYSTGKMQLLVNNTEGIYYRFYNGSWQPWRVLADVIAGKVPAIYNFSGDSAKAWLMNCDLDTITTPGMYGIQTSTASNKPAAVTSGTLTLWVGGVCDETTPIMSLVQAAFTKDSLFVRARSQNSDSEWVWTAWTQIGGAPDLGVLANFQGLQARSWKDTDLNSVKDPGMYAFNPASSATTNKPTGLTGTKANLWIGGTPNSKSQLVLNEGGMWMRVYAANTDTWTAWTQLGWTQASILAMVNNSYDNGNTSSYGA